MEKKQMAWKTKGMNRDLSVSAFNPEFAFENHNLRLATNDGNTLLSWVNERGTKEINLSTENPHWSKEGEENVNGAYTDEVAQTLPHGEGEAYSDIADAEADGWSWHKYSLTNIEGTPIGTAVINHKLVVFTTKDVSKNADGSIAHVGEDKIYILEKGETEDALLVKILHQGDLNFDAWHPLETLVSYESEDVQKVYWTDGKNQPRMINIVGDTSKYTDTSFDFVQRLKLEEEVVVKKSFDNSGMFASGVIQYAMTYYNKNGQESNIFYTTPLYYISYKDRGASPEDSVDNSFKISITHVDENFDYLRIYSIQRTSVNGTPICKRIADINIGEMEYNDPNEPHYKQTSYIDRGLTGNTVDPYELLYKGGEEIIAGTMEQKDGTLFLGNIAISRDMETLTGMAKGVTMDGSQVRSILAQYSPRGEYKYASQLSAYVNPGVGETVTESVPCGYFKAGENYRWGIQFQHETGKWSEPIWLGGQGQEHCMVSGGPTISPEEAIINLPKMTGTLNSSKATAALSAGYKKIRAVVVFPNYNDRNTICQGVINPTVYTANHRNTKLDLYAQSSWFFRTSYSEALSNDNIKVYPKGYGTLTYTNNSISTDGGGTGYDPVDEYDSTEPYEYSPIRQVEIQGQYNPENKFEIDRELCTFHSPDIEFDTSLWNFSLDGVKGKHVGDINIINTFSTLQVQTETPSIGQGGGFLDGEYSNITGEGAAGIVAGPYYEDYIVDEFPDGSFGRLTEMTSMCKWLIYPWQKEGSLNNDINRPSNAGVASAMLKKKVLASLRYAAGSFTSVLNPEEFTTSPVLFSSNENEIIKVEQNNIYRGNVDTLLVPDDSEGKYFVFGDRYGINRDSDNVNTPFDTNYWWKTWATSASDTSGHGTYKNLYNGESDPIHYSSDWGMNGENIGDTYLDLVREKVGVRMKYKSTPHYVMSVDNDISWNDDALPIIEIIREHADQDTLFGGPSKDALKENVWIPCGKPVKLKNEVGGAQQDVTFYWEYGDTYFQRWDCLKTYPFTREDVNQVVEIGSFMLETRVNIDGRYDRNRGLTDNTNVSPTNFNLLNPVYSQIDNFFSYKITDTEEETKVYPNRITWSMNKESGADVDAWTNVTLASTLELDGDKGKISKLVRLNDTLLAFQDTGIAQVLYNERAQVSTADGVPIELANSGTVEGKRYISNSIGCSNKWSVVTTPMGIYFMDSHDKGIYLFNGQLSSISLAQGFNSWCKQKIPLTENGWNPKDFSDFVGYYDKLNQDVLWINSEKALAWNEKLGNFTSFYDYGGAPYFCNLDEWGVWISQKKGELLDTSFYVWKHQKGDYCKFFNVNKPYWMTLVGNPEPLFDKTFTNMEFRACVDGDGTDTSGKFNFHLPFDSLETWDEYQHGIATLQQKSGSGSMQHHLTDGTASFNRKFRIWRCDIPRDNAQPNDLPTPPDNPTPEQQAEYEAEVRAKWAAYRVDENKMGIFRHNRKPMDRMRNPWLYLKLMKGAEEDDSNSLPKVEIHDMVMDYFV